MISKPYLLKMRKLSIILSVSILGFFTSCNSDTFQEHEIGDNLIDKSTEVRLIDTFTINSSTVKIDSMLTSGQSNILFGSYQDEFFGKISSDFYAVVGLGSAFSLKKVTVSENIEKIPIRFDSLIFISYPDGRYMGDTLLPQSMSIHRVIEEIEVPDDQAGFYAHSTFQYDEESLGASAFIAKPISQYKEFNADKEKDVEFDDGGIRFKMDDALGLEIVRRVNIEDDTILYADKWTKFFQGIVLKAGEDNSVMLSYNLQENRMKMRLYYTYTSTELTGTRDFHDFPVTASYLNFTNFKSDYSSAPYNFNQISEQTVDLSSEQTDDLAFIHGGLGLLTKIKIPYLEELNTIGVTGGVLSAELIFYPKYKSYDDEIFKLPIVPFTIYQTDERNQILTQLASASSNSGVSSNYVLNRENWSESYYTVNITSYVNNILLNGQGFDDALLLTLPVNNLGLSMDRLVIENDPRSDFRIRLKTTYVVQN